MLLLLITFGLFTMSGEDLEFKLKNIIYSDTSVRNAMSLDLGVEFMKMALVKPGIPMETILNRESQRKTPFALTIRNEERYFGDEALKKVCRLGQLNFIFFPIQGHICT